MNIFKIAATAILLSVIAGCATPTMDIMIKVPGKLNLPNISKIAVVNFNTLEDSEANGIKAVSPEVLKMAQGSIKSVFYEDPFYTLADLDVEKNIKKVKLNAKLAKRLDAIIYGRLWWQESKEYRNTYPKAFNLESWSNVKYKSGTNSITKKPIYSIAHITTQTKDVIENIPYRGKTYSLMMELNIYSVGKNGELTKLTRFFEVAKMDDIMDNGKISTSLHTINKVNEKNKLTAIKNEKEKGGFFSIFSSKEKKKDLLGDFKVSKKGKTISSDILAAEKMVNYLGKMFCNNIAPHYEKITIEINDDEFKSTELLKNGSYHATKRYLVEKVLAKGNKRAIENFYDIDFDNGAKSLALAQAKKGHYKVYKQDLPDVYEDFFDDNYEIVMNYAICEEALGKYERALAIYRYLFKNYPYMQYALGISRCLFALDMADKVTEKTRNKRHASKKHSLK